MKTFLSFLVRIFQGKEPLINAATLARCSDIRSTGKLYQKLVDVGGKPLKRLPCLCSSHHRAKAAVLMKYDCKFSEICGLAAFVLFVASTTLGAEPSPVRVLVWDEQQPEQKRAYDGGFL